MFTEDQLLPISALQHWLYCPRQCGLIHLEQVWAENKFTAEGQVLHHKAHEGADESKGGVRITRSLSVRSFGLGIAGQCDIVEFHPDGSVLPVEYKRGKPKSHRADEVQLCAQAMCMEEMLGVAISSGCLFYGEKKRRTVVEFDAPLRQLVTETAAALHTMINSRETPLAVYEARRCDACSLIELCQPKAMRFKRGAQAWFAAALQSQIDLPDSFSSNFKSEISNLKIIAESCSKQLRAWADSLQNSDIKGPRHLNETSRKEWEKKNAREENAKIFAAKTREIISKLSPEDPARRLWEQRNGTL